MRALDQHGRKYPFCERASWLLHLEKMRGGLIIVLYTIDDGGILFTRVKQMWGACT